MVSLCEKIVRMMLILPNGELNLNGDIYGKATMLTETYNEAKTKGYDFEIQFTQLIKDYFNQINNEFVTPYPNKEMLFMESLKNNGFFNVIQNKNLQKELEAKIKEPGLNAREFSDKYTPWYLRGMNDPKSIPPK